VEIFSICWIILSVSIWAAGAALALHFVLTQCSPDDRSAIDDDAVPARAGASPLVRPHGGNAHQRRVYRRFIRRVVGHYIQSLQRQR
jgi:hypothetical protein